MATINDTTTGTIPPSTTGSITIAAGDYDHTTDTNFTVGNNGSVDIKKMNVSDGTDGYSIGEIYYTDDTDGLSVTNVTVYADGTVSISSISDANYYVAFYDIR